MASILCANNDGHIPNLVHSGRYLLSCVAACRCCGQSFATHTDGQYADMNVSSVRLDARIKDNGRELLQEWWLSGIMQQRSSQIWELSSNQDGFETKSSQSADAPSQSPGQLHDVESGNSVRTTKCAERRTVLKIRCPSLGTLTMHHRDPCTQAA
jgi:hypothetical protein